jgi:hypothetical protein
MSTDLTPIPTHPDVEQLKAWVDRELAPAAEPDVAAHVSACPICTEEVRIMRQLGSVLKELDSQVEPPAQLRQRILASTVEATAPRAGSRSGWLSRNPFHALRWAMAAAVVAIIAFIGINNFPARLELDRVSKRVDMSNAREAGQMRSPSAAAGGAPRRSAQAEPPGAQPPAEYGDSGRRESSARSVAPAAPGAPAASPDDVNVYARGASVDDVTRKVMRIAVLSVRTRSNLDGVQKEIEKRLKKDDGYVESANLSTPEGGERTAFMRLRVPVDKLDEYVTWLASLGEVRARNVRGEDMTGTWIDQRAEVRELRKEEARLLKVYNTDPNRNRRDEARWQLLRIRPRIAASEERFALTTKLAALSTVELTLVEPAQARIQGNLWQDIDSTARSAVSAFMVALRVPAALLIWLVVFCPLWLPCLLVYRWAARRAQRWQPR